MNSKALALIQSAPYRSALAARLLELGRIDEAVEAGLPLAGTEWEWFLVYIRSWQVLFCRSLADAREVLNAAFRLQSGKSIEPCELRFSFNEDGRPVLHSDLLPFSSLSAYHPEVTAPQTRALAVGRALDFRDLITLAFFLEPLVPVSVGTREMIAECIGPASDEFCLDFDYILYHFQTQPRLESLKEEVMQLHERGLPTRESAFCAAFLSLLCQDYEATLEICDSQTFSSEELCNLNAVALLFSGRKWLGQEKLLDNTRIFPSSPTAWEILALMAWSDQQQEVALRYALEAQLLSKEAGMGESPLFRELMVNMASEA